MNKNINELTKREEFFSYVEGCHFLVNIEDNISPGITHNHGPGVFFTYVDHSFQTKQRAWTEKKTKNKNLKDILKKYDNPEALNAALDDVVDRTAGYKNPSLDEGLDRLIDQSIENIGDPSKDSEIGIYLEKALEKTEKQNLPLESKDNLPVYLSSFLDSLKFDLEFFSKEELDIVTLEQGDGLFFKSPSNDPDTLNTLFDEIVDVLKDIPELSYCHKENIEVPLEETLDTTIQKIETILAGQKNQEALVQEFKRLLDSVTLAKPTYINDTSFVEKFATNSRTFDKVTEKAEEIFNDIPNETSSEDKTQIVAQITKAVYTLSPKEEGRAQTP